MTNKIIEIKNLNKSFNGNHVLKDVNLVINKGETTAIVGASGSGKSVLIKTIVGLLPADSGQILIDGVDVSNLNQKKRLKLDLSLGMLFQNSALFDSMTVLENIVFPLTVNGRVSADEQYSIAKQKLQAVGLEEEILELYPASLSGGMKKRVALARLLTQNPRIMFFDEPTSGLDPISSYNISWLIKEITKPLNATSIIISHDIPNVCRLANKIFMVHEAVIYWQGTVEQFLIEKDPIVSKFISGV